VPGAGYRLRLRDAGDVDGDGTNDLLVGSQEVAVHIYSGCDGRLLFATTQSRTPSGCWPEQETGFGVEVASFVDARGAGFVLIASPEVNVVTGHVKCWSIAEQRQLYVVRPPAGHEIWHFGSAIQVLGDVDGDGTPDFACLPEHKGCGEPARIYVYSGSTGNLLWSAVRTITGIEILR
jgi:hypothetical protein